MGTRVRKGISVKWTNLLLVRTRLQQRRECCLDTSWDKSPPLGLYEKTKLWVITSSNENRWLPWSLQKKPIRTSDLNFSSILSFIYDTIVRKPFSSFETRTLWSFLSSGSMSFQILTTVWQYNIIWKIDWGSWWDNGQTPFVLCHLL